MSIDIQNLQEMIAHLQAEMSSLHDELYAQQQDINRMTVEIRHLNDKLKSLHQGDGIINPADDTPPPHY